MFRSTLDHAEAFLKGICCDKCRQPSDKLEFIGSSCKHVFCWTCINEICEGKTFPLCPLCSLPVGTHHVAEATFASELFQNLLLLKENLAEFDVTQVDRQTMLSIIEPDQKRRTVEEFCSTQQALTCNDVETRTAQPEVHTEKSPSKFAPSQNNDSLGLLPVPDDVTPFTQPPQPDVGTSDVQMTQQPRIYKEPEEFQFFKEPPTNTFSNVAPKKRGRRGQMSSRKPGDKAYESGNQNVRDSDATSSTPSPSRRYECTLINAAIRGSKKKLLEALENGEDANDCDNLGQTALYHAASRNSTEICKILIENGALINAHGGDLCDTALHAAVRWQAVDAVEYLLTRGANRRAFNLKGETPMDLIKDDKLSGIFDKISHPVQIVYPSRTLKRYSIFLSATLTDRQLAQGKRFFSQLAKSTTNFETATHLIVPVTENNTVEISVEILEAMLRGQYVLSSEWLDKCLKAKDLVDEDNYEIKIIKRNGQLVATNSCSAARKNRSKMKPDLFRGCHFYFCKHKYAPYRDQDIKKLVALAGGVLLGREPNAEEYIRTGMKPYHSHAMKNGSDELSGLFTVYMPGQFMPRRVVEQKFINLVTPFWITDCIAKFTLLRPEDR